jgi:peptide chain release factor subunit 1
MSEELEMQQRRLKARNALDDLSNMRGMGTELVTVIIPPDRAIHDVRQQLSQELGQASNIKSKQTKKHVSDAIESAISSINNMRETPPNGIAIFTGHVIVGNNKTRMTTIVLDEPPEPFRSFRYRCDSTFEVTQLEDMLIDKTCYGIFVIDRGEAAYGLASGKSVHCQEEMQSNIMGKHRQGGQSAQRFERLIEEHAHKFFKRAAEHASDYWLGLMDNMEGIIIGGPGATKDQVLKGEFFHHEVAKLVRRPTFDVGYSNESGLRELVQRAGGLMHEIELDAERQLVDRFLSEIMQRHPKATYGETMVRSALEQGAVDTLLLSEALRKIRQAYTCRQCQHGWQITTGHIVEIPKCASCGAASDQVREDPDNTISLMDEFTLMAGHSSSTVKLISRDTEEGDTLMEAFGGLAALLRYPWS